MPSMVGQLLIALGINSSGMQEGLNKATRDARQAARDMRASFQEAGVGVQALMSQLTGGLSPALQAAGRVASSAFSGITSAFSSSAKSATMFTGVIGGAGLVAGAAAAGLSLLAKEGSNVVFEYERMSEKTGIGIRDLQTLKAVGESVGVGFDVVTLAFRKFSQVLSDVGRGGQLGQSVLRDLGVTAREPMEALRQVADGFKKMNDVTLEGAYAQILFGRAGLNYLPVLKQGSQVFDDYNKIVEKYGTIIGKDATEATDRYRKASVELSVSWEGVKIAATPFIEALTDINQGMVSILNTNRVGEEEQLAAIFGGPKPPQESGEGMAAWKQVKSRSQQEADNTAANQADKDKQRSLDQTAYEEAHAHGAAAYALFKAQKQIQDDIVKLDYVHAAQIERTIPALMAAKTIEDQQRSALINLPRTMKEWVGASDAEKTKAQAAAMRDGTAAAVEAAAAQDALAMTTQMLNKEDAEHIANTDAFKKSFAEAAPKVTANIYFRDISNFTHEAEAGMISFTKQITEQAAAFHGEATEAQKVEQQQAKNNAMLVPYQQKLDEANKLLADSVTKYGLMHPDTQKLVANVNEYTDELEKAKGIIAGMNADVSLKIYNTELGRIKEQTAGLQAQVAALSGGDQFSLIGKQIEKFIASMGSNLNLDQIKALRDALKEIKELTIREGSYQVAASVGFSPQEVDRLEKIKADMSNLGMSSVQYAKALAIINAELTNMTAKTGGMQSGVKAAMADFIAQSKSMGQVTHDVILKGLDDISQSLSKTILTGKGGWKNMLDSMAEMIMQSSISKLLADLFKGIQGSGGFGGAISTIFNGFAHHAAGGDVAPGMSIVGENGPELFSTNVAGHITSNNDLQSMFSGGAGQVHYTIDARGTNPAEIDARINRALQAAHPSAVVSSMQAQREASARRPASRRM